MRRYFIEISYNGTDYYGWQRQPRQHSVQEEIENALSKLHSNKEIPIVGCGRTDTGVHAKQYFLHVDLENVGDTKHLIFKLNRMLPDSIVIHGIQEVSFDDHARFGAKERTYRYFIHLKKDAFINEMSWYFPQEPDFGKMNEAAQHFLGKQDFTSLSKLHTDVKTNICTVTKAEWVKHDDDRWYFEIAADRFLRNMVRATVGTLLDVGLDKIQPDDIKKILEAKDRGEASTSVPAHGLFLWKIIY
ncbi:MAG: tRNA pseudouridine(38-40) synthase TruA [Flavobacteriia bacterium]|jgi:tRNA pseudouridine38-40 synthase